MTEFQMGFEIISTYKPQDGGEESDSSLRIKRGVGFGVFVRCRRHLVVSFKRQLKRNIALKKRRQKLTSKIETASTKLITTAERFEAPLFFAAATRI